jgi:nucleoside-diphosphate-sugar epimerase
MLNGDRPTVFGDGNQTRDFTFVDNVVEANMLAMSSEGGVGDACNIATGGCISLNSLLQQLAAQTGNSANPTYMEPRPGDIRDSFADTSKALSALGYRPVVSVEEGLRRTVDWYRRTAGCVHAAQQS